MWEKKEDWIKHASNFNKMFSPVRTFSNQSVDYLAGKSQGGNVQNDKMIQFD